ncbi:MAG TPA: TetR/AcrR family transcriptional regulator [Rhizobiaceae bacterium]|nr:TetR/AcrR family transcriptional regulator [Rhizobiaceae bacterium]
MAVAGKSQTKPAAADSDPFDRSDLKERRRKAVIRAAASLFSRKGFHNTSMDDVAAELSVSKPTLYNYFPTKQKLLYEFHMAALDDGEAALAYAQSAGKNGHQKLVAMCRRNMEDTLSGQGPCAFVADVDSLPAEDRAKVVTRRDRISAGVRDIIEEGNRDGSLKKLDPSLGTLFVTSVLNWIPVWYRPDGERSPEEIVTAFLDMFQTGLARKRI